MYWSYFIEATGQPVCVCACPTSIVFVLPATEWVKGRRTRNKSEIKQLGRRRRIPARKKDFL